MSNNAIVNCQVIVICRGLIVDQRNENRLFDAMKYFGNRVETLDVNYSVLLNSIHDNGECKSILYRQCEFGRPGLVAFMTE